jgi:hypothetical protein
MTATTTLTKAQEALKNYYEAIRLLENTGVITRYHGDELSAAMVAEAGDYEDLKF